MRERAKRAQRLAAMMHPPKALTTAEVDATMAHLHGVLEGLDSKEREDLVAAMRALAADAGETPEKRAALGRRDP